MVDPLAHARELLRRVPLADGHNDLLYAMRNKADYDFDQIDIANDQPDLHTDIPRLRAGGVSVQFWSVYVPSSPVSPRAVVKTLEQIDAMHRMVDRYPETFEVAYTADDVERIFAAGRIASLAGMEGGHSIGNSLGALRMMHRLGARYMTLTHNDNTAWADSATAEPKVGGLNDFGEEVVREMNRLGMLVDLSHVAPDTMRAALRVSEAPIVFSHSSCRALCDVPRDVPDDVLASVPGNGGVCMITFVPGFVSQEVVDYNAAAAAAAKEAGVREPRSWYETETKAFYAKYREEHPRPAATLAQVADHVDHAREIAGVDHLGLGGDYDGCDGLPEGLEDVARYPHLFAELIDRGWSDDDLTKLAGHNVIRALRDAETVAARLQKERPASKVRAPRAWG
ncbi:MAG: membrane dipeptidase [Streptosporangiales bacterium]|nr:membrane dipeptidase [Streptosporangiales bacterium]